MKKTIVNAKLLLMGLVAVLALSCSAEDGEDGAIGPQGPAGVDGVDGNANVSALKYDLSTVSGSFYNQEIPEITDEVLNNYAILTYLKLNNGEYNPIPGTFFGVRHIVRFEVGLCKLDFARVDTETSFSYPEGNLAELRVVLIAPSNISGKIPSITDLKKAGVDVSNYYEVMDYFGLDY